VGQDHGVPFPAQGLNGCGEIGRSRGSQRCGGAGLRSEGGLGLQGRSDAQPGLGSGRMGQA
jgi:hypothetical protein